MVAASTKAKPEREALIFLFLPPGFWFLFCPVLPFPHEGFLTVTVDLPVFSPGFPTGFLRTVLYIERHGFCCSLGARDETLRRGVLSRRCQKARVRSDAPESRDDV